MTEATAAFRATVGRFASGVTVLSTRDGDVDLAMTASAFASVSLDPLLVLVCVGRGARFHDAVLRAGAWGVSVLAEDARAASEAFARRGAGTAEVLASHPHHRGERTGAVLLDAALATLECRTGAVHPAGDHSILVGEVLAHRVSDPGGRPLLYYRGGYHQLGTASGKAGLTGGGAP